MIRSKEVITKIKELETGVHVYENLLDPGEVARLLSWYEELKSNDANNIARAFNQKTGRRNFITPVSDYNFSIFHEQVGSRLNLRDFVYDTVQFYNIQNPYHIHSDTGKNNVIAYKQGVVPLEVNPSGQETYTVIFDQRVYFASEYIHPLYKKSPRYEPFYNIGTWDPTTYEGWSDEYKIPDDVGEKLWLDQWSYWREVYKGFSIKAIFPWKIGDVLVFDRSLLHAASLLDVAGVENKVGILFLTEHRPGQDGMSL